MQRSFTAIQRAPLHRAPPSPYSAIEKRAGRLCVDFLGRSTRAVAPRMNSTAQNATIAQMQRITVKALISCLEDWKPRLLLSALFY
ncbi:hypothetical protein [Paraburkholderia strydomiana]|uniref:hypothetical protein n=1 Tax=Paraburkholderia strydomiana TaxID=1245417 RepID=UPI0038BBA1B1